MIEAGHVRVNGTRVSRPGRDIGEGDTLTVSTILPTKRAKEVTHVGSYRMQELAKTLLREMHAKHGPIALVHFDAHLDTWDTYFGAPMTHGTPFRRASEEGLIDLTASMHAGTRGPLYGKGDLEDDERLGFTIVTTEYVEENGVPAALQRIRDRVGDKPLYISIDIDVLDPSHAPGTGTPEAGGLTSRELLRIIRGLSDLNIVGADVVEVAPAYDHAQITAVAASHVVYELISAMGHSA